MNDVDFPVATVLEGIDAAARRGPRAGQGQHGGEARHQRRHDRADGAALPRQRPHRALHRVHGRRRDQRLADGRRGARARDRARASTRSCRSSRADPNYAGEVAERWRYLDGGGEVGVIASVTQAFCRDCTRARLSTDGKLYTCLFATDGYDLRALLRDGRRRRRDRQRDRRHLAAARRPLFRNPHRQHPAHPEDRDELHRRMRTRPACASRQGPVPT